MGDLDKKLAHACQLTVLTCIDYRLHGAWDLRRCLEGLFGVSVKYDLLTVPGACFRLVHEGPIEPGDTFPDGDLCSPDIRGLTEERELEPEDRSSVVLSDLGLAVSLHHPETIVLVQHENCGRYHGVMTFQSLTEERRVLLQDLLKAAEILRALFPRLRVLGFIARIDVNAECTTGLDKVFDSSESAPR